MGLDKVSKRYPAGRGAQSIASQYISKSFYAIARVREGPWCRVAYCVIRLVTTASIESRVRKGPPAFDAQSLKRIIGKDPPYYTREYSSTHGSLLPFKNVVDISRTRFRSSDSSVN